MKKTAILLMLLSLAVTMAAKEKTVKIQIAQTTDVHGHFFPYDFIRKRDIYGSLASVSTYVKQLRKDNPEGVILLENGDILQGQPANCLYNFWATDRENIAASCVNYIGYDAQNMGNHDVEAGHKVYDKWAKELRCPVLGANVIDEKTGKPYFKPYTIIKRQGVRVAVIGLITSDTPLMAPESMWMGLRFEDIATSARKWVDYVKKNERPDIIVGLFHSGRESAKQIAHEVPGFDVVFFGHDHHYCKEEVDCVDGRKVVILNPSSSAYGVALAEITLTKKGDKVISKNITGTVDNSASMPADEDFMNHFHDTIEGVKAWTESTLGTFAKTITTRDGFFGSSAFRDLILNLELQETKADIAFAASLGFDTEIKQGPVTVSDMFKLFKYEYKIFVMKMTGREIRNYLEMSYDQWVNTMKSPDDHIMLLDPDMVNNNLRYGFKNILYNFDSAAGIDYEVDVTKQDGEKVRVLRMSDGKPFDESKWYSVALSIYRYEVDNELLTKGAGIPKDSLQSRVIYRTDRDQRHYLMKEIVRQGTLNPMPNNNWRFVPTEWTEPAIKRDRNYIYNEMKRTPLF